MNQKTIFGHPVGLFVLFFTEMWERFSYYGMRAILLLFLLDKISGMGLAEGEGGAVYGMYTFSVYLLALPGGWLADNVLGQRKAIWYGGIVIMLGHLVLAVPSSSTAVFFLGLGLVAIGTGLLKPNISSIVSELYPEGGARRDAAFSIFYMGINLGSVLGITIVGYLGQKVNWHTGFGAAAVAMFLGLIVYRFFADKYLSDLGMYPKKKEVTETNTNNAVAPMTWLLGMLLLGYIVGLKLSDILDFSSKSSTAMSMGLITAGVIVVYFANLLVSPSLDNVEKKRIGVLAVLFLGAVLFWAGFEQQGSSLQLFADRYTELPSWFPSSWFQNFNPAFILIFSPILGALWIYLEKIAKNPSTPLKFSIGLFLLALGYFVMVKGSEIAISGTKTSALFLTFTYLFHTLGELCLSPVGLSAYTKLAPKQYLSQLMGIWFVAAALGNLVAGLFAGGFDPENAEKLPQMFMSIVWFCLVVGGTIFVFQSVIKKAMGGVK